MRHILLLLLISLSGIIWGQTATISGTITDTDEYTVPMANIQIQEDGRVFSSDIDGNYSIGGLKEGTYTLIFSSFGYTDVTFEVSVKEDEQKTLDVVLGNVQLDEVVGSRLLIDLGARHGGHGVEGGVVEVQLPGQLRLLPHGVLGLFADPDNKGALAED